MQLNIQTKESKPSPKAALPLIKHIPKETNQLIPNIMSMSIEQIKLNRVRINKLKSQSSRTDQHVIKLIAIIEVT